MIYQLVTKINENKDHVKCGWSFWTGL